MSPLTAPVGLLAGLTGRAALQERLGDAETRHAVDRCLKRIERSVSAFQGRIEAIEGDGLRAEFSGLEAACQAASEIQERIADLPPVAGLRLGVRISIYTAGGASSADWAEAVQGLGHVPPGEIVLPARLLSATPLPFTFEALAGPVGDGPGGDREPLVRLRWHTGAPALVPPTPVAPRPTTPPKPNRHRLKVSLPDRVCYVDATHPRLSIGRDPGSDLFVDDRKVSRRHACIEWRDPAFYLIDCSTNGSFVMLEGAPEMMLRHDQLRLDRPGIICLGGSHNDPTARAVTLSFA